MSDSDKSIINPNMQLYKINCTLQTEKFSGLITQIDLEAVFTNKFNNTRPDHHPEHPLSIMGDSIYRFNHKVNDLTIFKDMMRYNHRKEFIMKYTRIAAIVLFTFTGSMVIIFILCKDRKESRDKTLKKSRSIMSRGTKRSLSGIPANEMFVNI